MGIRDLPPSERPRERLFLQGEAALSDAELLASLLGSGSRGLSALDLGQRLLERYGGVRGLSRLQMGELRRTHGIGPAKASALAAALELGRRAMTPRGERLLIRASRDVFEYLAPRLTHLKKEVFHVLCLDAKNRLLRDARVAEGGVAQCSLLPREIFAPAIQEGATGVIFVHNHPSGDSVFSTDDLTLTSRLKTAGEVLGIRALDHVVIGEGRYTSLVDEGRFTSL